MGPTYDMLTAVVTLLAVLLGGWLTVHAQERLWRRDHARQWRDIRLDAYREFLTAFRHYIAFVLSPSAQVTAVPHPRKVGDLMPFFDQSGTQYKEQLEATKTTVRLISAEEATIQACNQLVRHARLVAADRATIAVDEISSQRFEELWAVERQFVLAAREELGLTGGITIGSPMLLDRDVV